MSAETPASGWAAAEAATAHVFVPVLGDSLEVAGADGHHLQRARRVRAGERLTAADGSGDWRPYDVAGVAPGRLRLVAAGPVRREPDARPRIVVAPALTKGGLDAVAARLTELGVAAIEPVRAARSVVRWDAVRADAARCRLEVVVREAAARSRRATVPAVGEVRDHAELVHRPGLVVADRSGQPASCLAEPDGGEWVVLVGPEGGWETAELEVLGSAPRLRLGPHVLRAETAPVAAVGALLARGATEPL